jgi:SAM-dependent methyltransferase
MSVLTALHERHREAEIMDRPDLELGRHRHALAGLARINWICRSAHILWPALRELLVRSGRPIRVLDVATGAGDVPIELWHKARSAGFQLHIDGCDRSEAALEFARMRAVESRAELGLFQADALSDALPEGYDAVICSTFLHHLEEAAAVNFLGRMAAAAGRLVLVNDLRRSPAGWLLARAGTLLVTRSDVVQFDGPASVRAAFTVEEARRLAEKAGLGGTTVVRRWPFRYLLTWWRAER